MGYREVKEGGCVEWEGQAGWDQNPGGGDVSTARSPSSPRT